MRPRVLLVDDYVAVPTLARAADQQDLPKQLTLSQAITIALSKNSILRAAQSRLDQASGRYAQARSQLLPRLGLDARQTILLRSAGT